MEQLDQDAVNLAKAIRQTESGGNFQARGGSGEYGAYQYTKPTWDKYSKKFGINVPIEQATPEQQNEVTYKQIKEWKDQGYNPGQIASMWNSGKPDAYLDPTYKGVNKKGVKFDVPAYAESVAKAYQTIKQGGQVSIDPQNPSAVANLPASQQPPVKFNPTYPQTQESASSQASVAPGIGNNIAGRVNDISQAIGDSTSGKQGITSGILQTAGAVAGAAGDVANSGLELLPGYKTLEKALGDKVAQYAQTPNGQAIVQAMQEFQQQHPEASKNIGATVNIVSAIPILRGLGVVKDVALDSASLALKHIAENAAIKDLTATATKTAAGRQALKTSPESIKILVKSRALPDVVDGRYNTEGAFNSLNQQIANIEDNELQKALQSVSTRNIADRQSLEGVRQEALATIRKEFKTSGQVGKAEQEVNRVFDDYKNSYGDYVTLQDVNDMKRGIRQSVNFNSPKLDSDVTYHIGQVFMKNIENKAKKLGLPDIEAINKRMGDFIKAQKMLKNIDGKSVNLGTVGGLLKTAGVAGGEMLGAGTGIPFAGAYAGYKGASMLGKLAPASIRQGILERTQPDAIRQTLGSVTKKVGGLLGGISAQKTTK